MTLNSRHRDLDVVIHERGGRDQAILTAIVSLERKILNLGLGLS